MCSPKLEKSAEAEFDGLTAKTASSGSSHPRKARCKRLNTREKQKVRPSLRLELNTSVRKG